MPVKSFKPTSDGVRFKTVLDYSVLSKVDPEKSLLAKLNRKGGRNSYGRITVRHRGGGHARKYRLIDFKRNKFEISGVVKTLEYDPNRSTHIALVQYPDGEKRYILAPLNLNVGDKVISSKEADIKPGNALPLTHVPVGTLVHNIEIYPGRGGQFVRSAGGYAQVMGKEGGYVQLRMPSGEMRKVPELCMATVGQLGNTDHENVKLGKAGRKRWLGIRPTVRGVAMNPVDHPLGGGEGRTSGGRHPCSPWGWPTKGYKTRKNKRTDKFIVRRRKAKK